MANQQQPLNVEAVRAYLEAEFPGFIVEAWPDQSRGGYNFRAGSGDTYRVYVTDTFFDETPTEDVGGKLRAMKLAKALRKAKAETAIMVMENKLRPVSIRELRAMR
ncbi:MAG: hypothetical protein HY660_10040 [Armatimonadetes bacterium]|nr:hypothetical protein [Armatimonadota bacterium]